LTSQDVLGFLPFVLLFVVFWFFLLRPARKKQQAVSSLRASLAVGDSVLLGSGFYGRIEAIDEDTHDLRLEIAPGVVVRAHRDAVVSKEGPAHSDQSGTEPEDGPASGSTA
jgi:preprotein translocase subunit YajC